MAFPCRVLIDEPGSGNGNMALDEALLESVAQATCEHATLRFYQWKEPTLSLGYFQSHEDRHAHLPSKDLPLVRRSSGGGALIHHHELTYSLALPTAHSMAEDAVALTCLAHRALRESLIEFGWKADALSLCEPPATGKGIDQVKPSEPFLCFQRRAKGDLLANADSLTEKKRLETDLFSNVVRHKICGSAQRKRRGAVLQHGGILLASSPAAPELLGLNDLSNLRITANKLQPAWERNLLQSLNLEQIEAELVCDELELAKQLETTRFASSEWIERR